MWAKGTKNLEAYLKLMQAREIILQGNEASNARARAWPRKRSPWTRVCASLHVYGRDPHDGLYGRASISQGIPGEGNRMDAKGPGHGRLAGGSPRPAGPSLYVDPSGTTKASPRRRGPWRSTPIPRQCITWRATFTGLPESRRKPSRCKKSIRLEPFAPGLYYSNLGMAYFQNGTDCDEAVKACERTGAHARRHDRAAFMAVTVFSACGKEKEARKAAKELLRINPKFSAESLPIDFRKNTRRTRTGFTEALQRAGL